jgi:hypothetical protein
MRPPRFTWREMARRAASIWRAVRRPRSVAFRPKSPNDTLAPRVAMPVLRPFCSLRNFLRAGCSIAYSPLLPVPGAATLRTRLTAGPFGARRRRPRPACRRHRPGAAALARRADHRDPGADHDGGRRGARTSPDGADGAPSSAAGRRQGRGFARGQAVAAVDPALDADDAVRGLGFREAVVDVGLQRVQRHATLAIPLAARDLDAVQAARTT